MAHVVGVPRRDPCHKCQLPVFLAERLTVGKKVYHRTCLKCARCNSQLTPGSFYETEVDNEFCCEICPDEEEMNMELHMDTDMDTDLGASNVPMRSSSDVKENRPGNDLAFGRATGSTKGARSSIADRLAFFEQSKGSSGGNGSSEVTNIAAGSKLLQRSVSDEEKTKSLQRMEAKPPAYKMNSALSNFLHDTVDGEEGDQADEDGESEPTTSSDSRQATQLTTSSGANNNDDTEDEESLESAAPPPVPATEIPQSIDENWSATKTRTPTPAKRFTATAQLELKQPAEPLAMADHESISGAPAAATSSPVEATRNNSSENNIINNNNNSSSSKREKDDRVITTTRSTVKSSITMNLIRSDAPDELDAHDEAQQSIATNLELSEPNDNDCITKDKTVDAPEQSSATTTTTTIIKKTPSHEDDEKMSNQAIEKDQPDLECNSATSTGPEPLVEAEASASSEVELRTKPASSSSAYDEDAETTERLSVVRARLQQFEVIANNNINNNNNNNNNIDNDNNVNANVKSEMNINLIPDDEIVSSESSGNSGAKIETATASAEDVIVQPEQVVSASTETMSLDVEATDGTEETEKTEKISETVVIEATENPQAETLNEVPLDVQPARDSETVESKPVAVDADTDVEMKLVNDQQSSESVDRNSQQQNQQQQDQQQIEEAKSIEVSPRKSLTKVAIDEYPEDLNPFKSDDEDAEDDDNSVEAAVGEVKANKENIPQGRVTDVTPSKGTANLNPFDSSDDEIELEKSRNSLTPKVPPPRPPPPRISRNPFGDDTDEDTSLSRSSLTSSLTRKTPVPTPRTNLSQNPTPEPTPRLSTKTPQSAQSVQHILQNSSEYYGSANSLTTPPGWQRNSDLRGSNNSLTSSGGGTIRSRKNRKAPAPPPPPVKELFPSTETVDSSINSTPSSSTRGSPRSGRKKRPAPAPPKPARLDPSLMAAHELNGTASKNSLSYPLQSDLDSKLSDEEKALLEGKQLSECNSLGGEMDRCYNKRLIPLDSSLLNDPDDNGSKCDDLKQKHSSDGGDAQVVYRRMLVPPPLDTPTHDRNPLLESIAQHDRQLEKLKDNKEAKNRNRQSQISASSGAEDSDPMIYNKSAHGKWKRRKGPAPALPVPPRKVLQMLPLQEIRHELDIIEVQQQGLEKQGVILEKMIRDRCEGKNGELINGEVSTEVDGHVDGGDSTKNSKEVEDLILQLFELVNEKNELFRRQAELMYLRRMHRLEQEQADLEYEIRVLMAQPERNKTDTDKAREEALIARMVEVVQLRNEVVECLEMDRLREAEEDQSIKQRLEMHMSKRDESEKDSPKVTPKLSKKEKKKQKEAKKLGKSKKMDADKDADESELAVEKPKSKKKKRKFLF